MPPILRRGFLPGLFLLALLAPAVRAASAPPRPNILFVFADDWGRHASAYAAIDGPGTANDLVRTPHFDRIAREGALFRRAFVSAPSCTPCRSALLSGQHFWRTGRGAILHGAVWDGSLPSFPLLLRQAGYHIGETYKVWSPGLPDDAPFDAPKHAYEAGGTRFNKFSRQVTALMNGGATGESARQEILAEVRANFDAFLAARKPGTPFFYWFGPTNTHRPWARGSGQRLWGLEPDRLKGKLPPFLPDVPEIREDFADYLGEIQAVDAAIGLLVARLEELGELDRTLIVLSGDHGAPGFARGKCNLYDFGVEVPLAIRGPGIPGGRVVDDLVSLPDLAPTLLAFGGVEAPAVMTGRSLANLLRSDRRGQVEPGRDAVYFGRERHVDAARAGNLPYPQRAIRTHEFLYIVNFHPERWPLGEPYRIDGDPPPTLRELTDVTWITLADDDAGPTKAWLVSVRNDPEWKARFQFLYGKRPREELYDLARDPQQMTNVAADPRYETRRAELERRLMSELRRTGDPRLVDDGRYFETPPLAGTASGPRAQAAKSKKQ